LNRPIIANELRGWRTYALIWCAAVVVSTVADTMGNVVSQGEASELSILTVFAQGLRNTVQLGAIFSMILGGLIISKEEDEKRIEFLLSHPVMRLEIGLAKLAALSLLVLFLNIVLLVTGIVVLEVLKSGAGYDVGAFLALWLSFVVLVCFFAAAGMLFSAFVTKGGVVVGFSIGISLILGVLNALKNVENELFRLVSYVSPYRYFDIHLILDTGRPDTAFLAGFIGISVVFIGASLILYRRREFAV